MPPICSRHVLPPEIMILQRNFSRWWFEDNRSRNKPFGRNVRIKFCVRLLFGDRHITGCFHELFERLDRKSTRLNSSHTVISYAVFCLKKKKKNKIKHNRYD